MNQIRLKGAFFNNPDIKVGFVCKTSLKQAVVICKPHGHRFSHNGTVNLTFVGYTGPFESDGSNTSLKWSKEA